MTATLLRDIIEPTEWLEYTQEKMVETNRLVQSGIITKDAEFDRLADGGGRDVHMPFFKDLDGEDQVPVSSTSTTINELTVSGIATGKDRAVIHYRDKAFGSEDLAADFAGSDPLKAIGDRFAAFWVKREQEMLLSILDGVFSANLASNSGDLVNDVSVGSGATASNLIDADHIVDTVALLGDQHDKLTAIAMHSQPYFTLVKKNLIEFIPDSEGKLTIPTYLGKTIFVDDGCPCVSAATSGMLYTTYIFARGAVARGDGKRKNPVETDRNVLGEMEFLVHRRKLILHLRGVAWNNNSVAGVAPTNAECAMASNYTRVYQKKNIRVVALVTNG